MQFKDDLNEASWHELKTPVTTAGRQASALDDTPSSGARRFYRVPEQPAE